MNKKIVLDFIDAINEHNIDKICTLMSNDHKFIDAHGNEVAGKDKMRDGWAGYFSLFPDYKIEVTDIFEKRENSELVRLQTRGHIFKEGMIRYDFIVAFGFASGTFGLPDGKAGSEPPDDKNHFHLPASWKALIEGGKIKLWQVYCDTKIPFEIIERKGK